MFGKCGKKMTVFDESHQNSDEQTSVFGSFTHRFSFGCEKYGGRGGFFLPGY